MRILIVSVCLITTLLCSCEGARTCGGIVVDKDTGAPIENAEIIQHYQLQDTVRTDSSGRFVLSSGFVYTTFGGPKFFFTIDKIGYKRKKVKKSRAEITVRLARGPS